MSTEIGNIIGRTKNSIGIRDGDRRRNVITDQPVLVSIRGVREVRVLIQKRSSAQDDACYVGEAAGGGRLVCEENRAHSPPEAIKRDLRPLTRRSGPTLTTPQILHTTSGPQRQKSGGSVTDHRNLGRHRCLALGSASTSPQAFSEPDTSAKSKLAAHRDRCAGATKQLDACRDTTLQVRQACVSHVFGQYAYVDTAARTDGACT